MMIDVNDLKRGVRVVIKKGSVIKSTGNPKVKEAARDYVVKIHDVSPPIMISASEALGDTESHDQLVAQGYDFTHLNELRAANVREYYTIQIPLGQTKIVWVGTGGYWHETAVSNIAAIKV
jgi:hypothetical protein